MNSNNVEELEVGLVRNEGEFSEAGNVSVRWLSKANQFLCSICTLDAPASVSRIIY